MLLALKLKATVAAVATAVPMALTLLPRAPAPLPGDTVTVTTVSAPYRLAGDFNRDGHQVDAPRRELRFTTALTIMRRQVSAADYAACVAAGACAAPATEQTAADRPVTGVNYQDAVAYADWISARSGIRHRLPTDEEWTRAAAERTADEVLPLVDPADPAQAWLARYEVEARRERSGEYGAQPFDTFGVNSNGLSDLAGNVWEWTSTCFVRGTLEAEEMRVTTRNCGVKVVEGAHRAYLTDFIRDPRNGGCAFGAPPANLGFRLVVEQDGGPAPLQAASRLLVRLVR
jgi:formylglycine-generating enzyme required for sulfatase activity